MLWRNELKNNIKYGKEYLTAKGTGTPVGSPADTKDIDFIIKYGQGKIAEKTYLQKSNPDFVKTWATSLRNKVQKGTQKMGVFIWAHQPYSTYTGEKVWESNPIGKTGNPSGLSVYGFTAPDRYSASGNFAKGMILEQFITGNKYLFICSSISFRMKYGLLKLSPSLIW